ncbi:MAG: hypothetical protein ABI557_19755, partial [Aureliella sp.]
HGSRGQGEDDQGESKDVEGLPHWVLTPLLATSTSMGWFVGSTGYAAAGSGHGATSAPASTRR